MYNINIFIRYLSTFAGLRIILYKLLIYNEVFILCWRHNFSTPTSLFCVGVQYADSLRAFSKCIIMWSLIFDVCLCIVRYGARYFYFQKYAHEIFIKDISRKINCHFIIFFMSIFFFNMPISFIPLSS